jgi:ABC-type nitrate/sulfonate/bicarbonate transport system substrate-binding protein
MKIATDIRAALAGVVLSLAVLGLGSLAAGAAELVPFRVGEAAPANTFLAIWMAQAAGFYEAQGLQLEIVRMVGGSESGPELQSGRAGDFLGALSP